MRIADCEYIEGQAQGRGDSFLFTGSCPTGKLGIRVNKEIIIVLAKALEYTDSTGHAAWHVIIQPEHRLPCSVCYKSTETNEE